MTAVRLGYRSVLGIVLAKTGNGGSDGQGPSRSSMAELVVGWRWLVQGLLSCLCVSLPSSMCSDVTLVIA